jgi:hypothetical protein
VETWLSQEMNLHKHTCIFKCNLLLGNPEADARHVIVNILFAKALSMMANSRIYCGNQVCITPSSESLQTFYAT